MAGNGIVPDANVQDDLLFPDPNAKTNAGKDPELKFPTAPGGGVSPPPSKPYFDTVDVIKGAGSGAERGTADVAGMGGDLPQLGGNIAEYAIQKAAEKLGYVPPGGKELYKRGLSDIAAENEKLGKPMLPTSEDIKKVAAPLGTEYKPTSEWGERAQSGAESGVSNLIGGPEGMVGRAVAGTAGGILGTTARQNMGDNPYAAVMGPALDVFGQFATGHLIDAVKNLPTDARAQANLIAALSLDFQNGTAKISRAQLEDMIKTGVPLNIADIGGTETRSALDHAMSVTPANKTPAEVGEYNSSLNPKVGTADETSRLADSQKRMGQVFTTEAGGAKLDPAGITNQIEDQGRKELKQVYDIARDPTVIKANSIYASELDQSLQRNPILHDAIVNAEGRVANELDPSVYKIPSWSETEGELPGNIAFWDIVKRDLDTQYNKLKISGDKDGARQVDAIRKDFISHLDNISPEYKAARDKASEFFDSVSAPEAGQNFYKKADSMKSSEFENAFNQYSDEQKNYFKNGFLSSMNADVGRPGGASVLATKMTTDPEFQRKAQLILGENYNNVRNSVLAENIYTSAKQFSPAGGRSPLGLKTALVGIGSLGIGPAFQAIMDGAVSAGIFQPQYLLAMAPAAVVSAGAAARAKAVAQRTIALAASGNAEDFAKVAKLAASNPVAQRTLDRLNSYYQAINQQGSSLQPTTEYAGGRVGRATGGRTGKDPKKRAESLILLSSRIKNEEGKNTSSLLNLDDATVAKALAVANRHI